MSAQARVVREVQGNFIEGNQEVIRRRDLEGGGGGRGLVHVGEINMVVTTDGYRIEQVIK